MKPIPIARLTDWQAVFLQSKVNGAAYREPPAYPIKWPSGTWLEQRIKKLREGEVYGKEEKSPTPAQTQAGQSAASG